MSTDLHLPVTPEWDAIRTTWEPCDRFLRGNGIGGDDAYALCMVVQELLENAVKYGHYGEQPPPVGVDVSVAADEVTVEVKNPIGVDSRHLREFDRSVQWIRGFQDPFEAYVERLKLVSSAPREAGRSGLGLTRIAYEGHCILDFYVDASNTLAVSAVWRR